MDQVVEERHDQCGMDKEAAVWAVGAAGFATCGQCGGWDLMERSGPGGGSGHLQPPLSPALGESTEQWEWWD